MLNHNKIVTKNIKFYESKKLLKLIDNILTSISIKIFNLVC
jgi:hypothetical protein